MEAQIIYYHLKAIVDKYNRHDDQLVAIAKWIESEFTHTPEKLNGKQFIVSVDKTTMDAVTYNHRITTYYAHPDREFSMNKSDAFIFQHRSHAETFANAVRRKYGTVRVEEVVESTLCSCGLNRCYLDDNKCENCGKRIRPC